MKTIELKSRKLLRKCFNCFSLTAVAFIFQACYGMEPPCDCDVRFTGTVTSKTTNLPIKGIKVAVDKYHYAFTDENGKFDFYSGCLWDNRTSDVNVQFIDVDGIEDGPFAEHTISVKHDCKDEMKINAVLNAVESDAKE